MTKEQIKQILASLDTLQQEAEAKPPIGETESLWRARDMIGLLTMLVAELSEEVWQLKE